MTTRIAVGEHSLQVTVVDDPETLEAFLAVAETSPYTNGEVLISYKRGCLYVPCHSASVIEAKLYLEGDDAYRDRIQEQIRNPQDRVLREATGPKTADATDQGTQPQNRRSSRNARAGKGGRK